MYCVCKVSGDGKIFAKDLFTWADIAAAEKHLGYIKAKYPDPNYEFKIVDVGWQCLLCLCTEKGTKKELEAKGWYFKDYMPESTGFCPECYKKVKGDPRKYEYGY